MHYFRYTLDNLYICIILQELKLKTHNLMQAWLGIKHLLDKVSIGLRL